MGRFVRLLACAVLAAGLAAPSAASAQTGPLNPDRPSRAPPHKAKPRQTARGAQAKRPPPGRQITVHARPSYLTAGTQVPVGTVGNGYALDTFNQPSPISGTFLGMRGQERLTDRFSNAGPGLTLFRW